MKRQKNEDFDDVSQLRMATKRTEEGKKVFKTNVALVPKIAVIRKEEGATAAASHLPSLQRAASFVVGPVGQRFMELSKPSGKPH